MVENAGWVEVEDGFHLTGWLKHPDLHARSRLNAIAYNASGLIIGGGCGKLDFVPEKDRTGVSIPADISRTKSLVGSIPGSRLSPSLKGSWWKNIEVSSGTVDDYQHVSGGAILRNWLTVATETFYLLTVADADKKSAWHRKATSMPADQELVFHQAS